MGQSRPLFVYFRYFLDTISIIQIEKSVDGVLGIQTQGCRMVGADKTTELWRPPTLVKLTKDLLVWSNQNQSNRRFGHSVTLQVSEYYLLWLVPQSRPLFVYFLPLLITIQI